MKNIKFLIVGVLALTAGTTALAQNTNDEFSVDNLNYKITSLEPATVEVARNFDCTGDIVIPSTVTYNEIEFEVTAIGVQAFYFCRITSIAIPESVTSIGDGAFSDCSRLTSIIIPGSVTSIGNMAFFYCDGLRSVTIPSSVTTIGFGAFAQCYSLTSINIPESITSIRDNVFLSCVSLQSISIPESIISIGKSAFSDCYRLTSITIPTSVTSIGDGAFNNCNSLTLITIPELVISIGEYVFSGCTSLTAINVDTDNVSFSSENGVLFNYDKTVIMAYPAGKTETSYNIPSSVNSIDKDAFYNCTNLTSITIPPSVASIGDGAFRYCSNLTSINIPTSVTTIRNYTFCNCTRLTSINIPASLTWIGVMAFNECSALTSITFPAYLKVIDNFAFSYCSSLTSITSHIANPDSVETRLHALNYINNACTLYVPEGSLSLYQNKKPWSNFMPNIVGVAPDTVTTLRASDITLVSATLNGEINLGANDISEKGFEWKINIDETYQNIVLTSADSVFSANLTELTKNTIYIFRAYVKIENTKIYGEEMTFRTKAETPAIVTTSIATDITQTSATLNGEVIPGAGIITEKGFEWKSAPNGTFQDIVSTSTDSVFTANLTGLTENRTYIFRAYVKVENIKTYGEYKVFKTQTTGIEDITQVNIIIYPNPASDILNIKSDAPIHSFEMYDALGRLVLNKTKLFGTESTMDVSSLTHGIYFIKLRTISGTVDYKVVINN